MGERVIVAPGVMDGEWPGVDWITPSLPSQVPVELSNETLVALERASRSMGYLEAVHDHTVSQAGSLTLGVYEAVASARLAVGAATAQRVRTAFTGREHNLTMDGPATAAAGALQAILGLTPDHWGLWSDQSAEVVRAVLQGQRSEFRAGGIVPPRFREELIADIAAYTEHADAPALVKAAVVTMATAAAAPECPHTGMVARHLGLVVLLRAGGCSLRPPVSWGLSAEPDAWGTIATALAHDGPPDPRVVDDAVRSYLQAAARGATAVGAMVRTAEAQTVGLGGRAWGMSRTLPPSQEAVLGVVVGLQRASVRQLVAITGLTERTIVRAARALEARGGIGITAGPTREQTVVRVRTPYGPWMGAIDAYPAWVGAPWPDSADA